MADAHHTSHDAIPEHPVSARFFPLDTGSQHSTYPRNATLYLKADAPAETLYEAADYRLRSVIDLLSALRLGDPELNPYCAVSSSLLLLVSDAWSLYQADHEQKRGR
ncbi:hypothetical protein ACKI1H_27975 [Pseudomonas sp. YH-1]|uniref:hypothetical protein n=1 Tax=Pseudomonas sp. YH-1 TaxID=3384787 RepID=UPI003F7F2456